jgi:hypothetical protein
MEEMRNIVCDMCLNKGKGPKNVIGFALNLSTRQALYV